MDGDIRNPIDDPAPRPRSRQEALERLAHLQRPLHNRADLTAAGLTRVEIDRAVADGALLRLRRDHYATPDIDAGAAESVRIGGRLGCVSLLARLGVFVMDSRTLHVHLPPDRSRIREPKTLGTVLHWSAPRTASSTLAITDLHDAVAHAMQCQEPRAAIATLDSVLYLGLATREELVAVFRELPRRYETLLALADGSAESGPETMVRLILRALGVAFETQVDIDGVGRVDFIVEGWLIIECDSRAHHGGWEQQCIDRQRDIAAAAQGYVTIRPIAADVFSRPDRVRQQIAAVVAALGGRFHPDAGGTAAITPEIRATKQSAEASRRGTPRPRANRLRRTPELLRDRSGQRG